MNKEKVINILKSFEYFVDDDYGGHYENIDCSQRACTPLGILKILDYIDSLNEALNEIKTVVKGYMPTNQSVCMAMDEIEQTIDKVLGEDNEVTK